MTRKLSLILILTLTILCACTSRPDSHKSTRLLMGTYVEVTANSSDRPAKEIANLVLDELARIEALSSFHKESDLVKLNAQSGNVS